jgi:5-methylcytosine-specific restriction endonuclease McrA
MKRSPIRRSQKAWKKTQKRIKPRPKTLYANQMWSRDIRERDDFTCQRCGKRDEVSNQAHHVATRKRRPDLRYDRSNGKTVCPDCHRWIHDHPIEAAAVGLLSTDSYEKAQKDAA